MPILKKQNPKIAIVHDFLTYFGGAEQVLKFLHNLYPEAPIYTLLYDEKKMKQYFPQAKIRSSFLNKLPNFIRKRKKYLLPFFSTAVETFDLRSFDIVISSSNSFAKGIIIKPKTIHICYCHAPTRFLWDWYFNYLQENKIRGIKKILVLPFLHYIRMWDKSCSERVDYFIANSKNTAEKIRKFYKRESKVIYPPCDMQKDFYDDNDLLEAGIKKEKKCKVKDYFLIVSRLSSYKKIDIVIEAFNKLEIPLIIIGEGSDAKRLKKMSEKNIQFLGFQSREKLAYYYQNCLALIFPGEEDFGITPIEAMSFGKPILAYRKGGLEETMIEGVTGEFFDDQVAEILADGVRRIKNNYKNYDREKIKQEANKFSREKFKKSMKSIISELQ